MKTLLIALFSIACGLGTPAARAEMGEMDVVTAELLLEQGQISEAEATLLREFLKMHGEEIAVPSPSQPPALPARPGVPPVPVSGHCVIASGVCHPLLE